MKKLIEYPTLQAAQAVADKMNLAAGYPKLIVGKRIQFFMAYAPDIQNGKPHFYEDET